ncbi:hypothetical protein HKW98_06885 [Stutzerimonas urumqiensis]|uniref:hypothetical protein n=1 Tax=Stutzerimonas urumqiensis TaxID=638269 RepID=UPI003BA9B517
MTTMKKTLLALAATAPLIAQPALAADKTPNPYSLHDGTWIGIGGTVESAGPESFVLNYGNGSVVVEMDDWDWYAEGRKLLQGDQVTVYGDVDDDLYELTSIEANAVYVKGLNSFFFASAADEETPWRTATFLPTSQATIQGTVQDIQDREIILDTGEGTLTINTLTLGYNPFDAEGYQRIDVGDTIRVTGQMDRAFFGKREFNAELMTSLTPQNDEANS